MIEIPEAKFNRYGVAENSIVLVDWGDMKSNYFVTAVRVGDKIHTGCEYRTRRSSIGGGGGLPSNRRPPQPFRSETAAIEWHKGNARRVMAHSPLDLAVIEDSITAGEQLLLFG